MAISDIKTKWTPVKSHVAPVVGEVCENRKIYFVWGYANKPGEHGKGLALDFSILDYGGGVKRPGPARTRLGSEIANYLWTHRKRLNVWYVIWNRRIISTTRPEKGWIQYTGKSPHTDHVHVSFKATGTYTPPPKKDWLSMATPWDVAKTILYADVLENVDNKKNPKMTLAGAISNLEYTQDLHGKQLSEIKKLLTTVLSKLESK